MTKYKRLKTIEYRLCERNIPLEMAVKIESSEDIAKIACFLIGKKVKENFVVFWLATNNTILGYEIVSEGILNSTSIHPREVFRSAIIASCNTIVVAHNHPSGTLVPSTDDNTMTKKLQEAGKIIGIQLLDHVIVNTADHYSFANQSNIF